jgi:hypothetical protein
MLSEKHDRESRIIGIPMTYLLIGMVVMLVVSTTSAAGFGTIALLPMAIRFITPNLNPF